MNVVLDTNVIVAGLLSPFSPCGEILRMITAGDLILCLDARLLAEYSEVLRRPRFEFKPELIAALLDHLSHSGILVAASPLPVPLPDPDDAPFLEVALAGHAECLVTGNLRHFPAQSRQGIAVLSPKEFVTHRRKHGTKPDRRSLKNRA